MPDHDYLAYGRSTFEHQHLDYKNNSIRLLRILPGFSRDGLIQCELWHATVEHEHDCLSYEWISAGRQREILINGKIMKVSQHLWSFLRVYGPKYAASRRALWIDFICIHQNCASELNHQIPLMKGLYSSAHEVVAWLGFSEHIERAFAFWRELNTLQPRTYRETNKIWHSHMQYKNKELGKDWLKLAEHSYWRRSWITQEILCATKLKLLISDSEVMISPVPGISMLLPQYDTTSDSPLRTFHTYLAALCESQKIVGLSLVQLFNWLPGRESSKLRDRIYSLCSIASDGASVPIEYNSSDEDVLLQLLEAFKESICPCLIAYMAQALEVQNSGRLQDVSEHMPLFRITVNKAIPAIALGVTLDSPYKYCSRCENSCDDKESVGIIFCTHGFSHCLGGTHMYYREYWTENKTKKYQIKPENSETWIELFSLEDIDSFMICVESTEDEMYGNHLYLTAGVVIRLFTSISRPYQPRKIIELCKNAQNSKGSAALCKKTEVETVSKPEPCCSNQDCLRMMSLGYGYQLPEEYSDFRLSQQWIEHEVQHGTWASSSVMRMFLEDPGPWVPWMIKHPRSYPAPAVLQGVSRW